MQPVDDRQILADAVRATLATGSAQVRYQVDANPPDLADFDQGEGVANFRDRTSRVTYSVAAGSVHPDIAAPGRIEQIISDDTMYIRFGGPGAEWETLPLGNPEESGSTRDAGGYLDLLTAPGEVTLVATDDDIDEKSCRRYALVVKSPRSPLRTALAIHFRRRAQKRAWLEAWIDDDGHVRRVAVSNREPNRDGSLPRDTVRTTVDFDELGTPASVEIPEVM